MSLLIQSTPSSLTQASGEGSIDLRVPPAVQAGDVLMVIVASSPAGAASVDLEMDQAATLTGSAYSIDVFTVSVRTGSEASALPDQIAITGPGAMVATAFRVTGADLDRPVESAILGAEADQPTDVFASPSLEPEARNNNVLLSALIYSMLGTDGGQTVFAGGVNLAEFGHYGESSEDAGLFLALGYRYLLSSDASGTQAMTISPSASSGLPVSLMLRQENIPPTVTGRSALVAEVGVSTSLTVQASDPEGTPLNYVWRQVEGPPVDIAGVGSRSARFVPREAGVYVFECIVSDADGGRATWGVTVSVPTGASAPVAIVPTPEWETQDGVTVQASDASLIADGRDSTYIRTAGIPRGEPVELVLPPIIGGSAIEVTIRGNATNASPTITRTVELRDSGGIIAERSYVLGTTPDVYTMKTSPEETERITDRSTLRLVIADYATS